MGIFPSLLYNVANNKGFTHHMHVKPLSQETQCLMVPIGYYIDIPSCGQPFFYSLEANPESALYAEQSASHSAPDTAQNWMPLPRYKTVPLYWPTGCRPAPGMRCHQIG